MAGTKANPNLIFFLPKSDPSQIDEHVHKLLEKQGLTESQMSAVIEKANIEYENRVRVEEASREFKRLMGLKAQGMSLMQVGFRKWKEVFYPAVKKV
jgi:hypothetical protein